MQGDPALGPFENLLLVTGENPRAAGVDYIEQALKVCRPYFNNLTIEVMPLASEDYYRLTQSGLNGVVCFQETYNRANYNIYHPAGMKSKFEWRVNGFDRMGQAGVHKIGMGVLIGLEEWRTDVTMMALHLQYLRKHYWKTRYSVNFPRMCPSEGHFQPNVVMTDRELAQLTFAFRIFDHDVDISFSTREKPSFRNHIATLGATSMSADRKPIRAATIPIPSPSNSSPSATNAHRPRSKPTSAAKGTKSSGKTGTKSSTDDGGTLRTADDAAGNRGAGAAQVVRGFGADRRHRRARLGRSLYLTGAGVGRIGLADADTVSKSNLQRQVLYTERQIGMPKSAAARERLAALSSHTAFECRPEGITPENARPILDGYD